MRISLFGILLMVIICLSSCAPDAGVFAGGSWQASELSHQHIRTLAVDANNAEKLYAGDEQGTIFASNDGAQHWMQRTSGLPLPNSIHALSFDATDKKLYAATDAGLFVSSDAAQHWSDVSKIGTGLPTHSYTALAFDLKAPHTIYLGSAHHDVFMSANDGTTWASISNGLPGDAFIHDLTFDSDNHHLWAATSQGIYRSDNRGTTWQAFSSGLPANIVVYSVQPASASGGTEGLIFAGTNQGFFRSEDAGMHWSRSQQALSGTNIRVVFVDFRKPTTVYVGTDIGMLRSDDSGQHWGGIAPGLPRNQPVYAITLGAINYDQLIAATNNVYLFPGSSGGFSPTHFLPLLLIALLFYLLYRMVRRNQSSKRDMLKPERIIEQSGRGEDNEE